MIEQIFLLLLLLFAILALQQERLRTAIIYLAVFSLLASLIYLLHQSPDVAMAEAVIGSTLATVLYLVALRKQESMREAVTKFKYIRDKSHRQIIIQRLLAAGAAALLAVIFFNFYPWQVQPWQGATAASYYKENFIRDTGALNAVTAIYLNYRVYDTIFETLTLLTSVLGVIFFSRYHAMGTNSGQPVPEYSRIILDGPLYENIAAPILRILYPFIILTGFYTIINGHMSPGGGFQGGAILSAILILRYMTLPRNDMQLNLLQIMEKMMFLLIIAVPVFFIFNRFHFQYEWLQVPYLILLNALIGIKVCFGISIIFIRFVFYESR